MAVKSASAAHDVRRDFTLDQIAGHDLPKTLCGSMLSSGRLPHAMLLQGPASVGKTCFAWAWTKELLWEGLRGAKSGDEGEQRRLRLHSRVSRENAHPDVFVLEGDGALGQIRIDAVRDFEDERAHIGPVEGATKVCLIENAHRMNVQAANCLLKLLEEPPPHLKFVLTSDSPAEMLETIRSRCAVVPFQPLAEEELIAWLAAKTGEEDRAKLLLAARLADGRPGRALERLESSKGGDESARALDALLRLERDGFARVFSVAAELASATRGRPISDALATILACYRDALIHALATGDKRLAGAANELLLQPERTEALAALGKRGPDALMAAIDCVRDEMSTGRSLFHRELHLEAVLIKVGMAMRARAAV